MIAKLIAHGDDRDEAIEELAAMPRRRRGLAGEDQRWLPVQLLDDPDFEAAKIDTGFIERNIATN